MQVNYIELTLFACVWQWSCKLLHRRRCVAGDDVDA